MHWLTRLSLRMGTNGLIGFLTFIGVLNPIASKGIALMLFGFFVFLLVTTYRDYLDCLNETSKELAKKQAIANNAVDLFLFGLFVVIGLFLAYY